jgi:hypothetical protein
MCLRDGEGVKMDLAESMRWLRRAAEHGQPRAQWEVGCESYGEKPDLAQDTIAARWFRKSAEQLYPNGLLALGLCYRHGRGVPKDPIEGLAWIAIGGEHYDADQRKLADSLFEGCTDEELKKVDERAKVLKKECRDKFMAKREAKEK